MSSDLLIIGGGAAGITAAIESKLLKPSLKVMILEKKEMIGKKLKATGNGRCNLTHTDLPTAASTIRFFERLGIPVREDGTGRVYPFSESAPGVVKTLEQVLKALGVTILCDTAVTKLKVKQDGFTVCAGKQRFDSKTVLITTGGKAGPVYGCTGDGYELAKALGHQVTKTLPVLTGICCEGDFSRLKGTRAKGKLELDCYESCVFSENGEIQFTEYGISGICAFNLSRYLCYQGDAKLAPYRIKIDLAPGRSFEALFKGWQDHKLLSGSTIRQLLTGMMKAPLAELVVQCANLSGDALWRNLTPKEIEDLEGTLHEIILKPTGTMGFKMAQCTSGGIVNEEIDEETLMSKLVPGLFFAGEIMDYDGPCGGFNLDHAFTTGRRAGKMASKWIEETER